MTKQAEVCFDLETTPSVDKAVHARIAEEIQPPGNISKAETIAAWHAEKKPGLIHEAILKTALDGAVGHICVIGACLNEEDPVTFWRPGTDPHLHEVEILTEFFSYLRHCYSPSTQGLPMFIGHNIVGFDLRFLFQRAVILGVEPPAFIPFSAKPWDDHAYDNMLRWNGGDRSKWISQDKLSRALGQPGKQGMDGSMVWGAVKEGRIAEVADYCADDVSQARANYKRMTFQTLAPTARAA